MLTRIFAGTVLGLVLIGPVQPAAAENFWVQSLTAEQLYYRALYLKQHGRMAEAIQTLEDGARKGPPKDRGTILTLRELGDIFLGPGRYHNARKGIHALEVGALQGDKSAASRLARAQLDGLGTPENLDTLLPLYAAVAQESSNSAALLLARLTEEGRLGKRPATPATDWYRLAAERGSERAMRQLAIAAVTAGNDKEALAWIRRTGGDSIASFSLGIAKDYLKPGGQFAVSQNAAITWFRHALAADPGMAAGSARQFIDIASADDKAKLIKALRAVADKGDGAAAYLVARLLDGEDGAVNDEAIAYYLIAAWGGNADAVKAVVRLSGFLAADDPRAKQVFEGLHKAAEDGNTDAMLAVANYYSTGTLAERDMKESLAWYERAAKAGVAEAQFRTGVAYAEGLGTDVDVETARRWLVAANEQRYPLAAASLKTLESSN